MAAPIAPLPLPPLLRWQPVMAPPSLADADLHLWLLTAPDLLPAPSIADGQLLSSAERTRAAALRHPQRRACWVQARVACRRILGGYLGADPAVLRFAAGPWGKPALAGSAGRSGLAFNLSNSGNLSVLGVSAGLPLGVDCEWLRPRSLAVARRMFDAATVQALTQRTGADRWLAYHVAWTTLEARVKADGRGLSRHREPDLPGLLVGHVRAHPDVLCAVARQRLPAVSAWVGLRLAGAD